MPVGGLARCPERTSPRRFRDGLRSKRVLADRAFLMLASLGGPGRLLVDDGAVLDGQLTVVYDGDVMICPVKRDGPVEAQAHRHRVPAKIQGQSLVCGNGDAIGAGVLQKLDGVAGFRIVDGCLNRGVLFPA